MRRDGSVVAASAGKGKDLVTYEDKKTVLLFLVQSRYSTVTPSISSLAAICKFLQNAPSLFLFIYLFKKTDESRAHVEPQIKAQVGELRLAESSL